MMKRFKILSEKLLSRISDLYDRITPAQMIAFIVIILGLLFFVISGMMSISAFAEGTPKLPAFAALPFAIAKALIGCAILKLVDEIMLYEIPTMKNLKDNATSYALYMLGYAVIIAFSISTA